MKPAFVTICLKELRETLREKRTVGLLLLFTLMYPVMFGILITQIIDRSTRSEREGIELAVIGAAKAPTLMAQLKQKNITVIDTAPLDEAGIAALLEKKDKVAGVLRLSEKFGANYAAMRPARIELWFNSAAESGPQRREVEDVLEAYGTNVASARLLAHGVSPAALAPIQVQRYDTGTNASRSAGFIGSMLSMLFFPAFFCGMSAAIDSTAGERERRSLEVLMAQPMRARDLVVGKWLAASALAAIGLALELSVAHAILSTLPLEEIGLSWRLGLPMLAVVIAAALPLCLFVGALQVAMAMNSKTFKEAQAGATLVTMLPMVPLLAIPMLDMSTQPWMYAVPVLSNQTMLQSVASHQALGALPWVLTCAVPLLLAWGAVAFAARRMRSEQYVMGI